jgi:hypothetical protein
VEWINFTQYTRGWLDQSKNLYDVLEPGHNRSMEPVAPELPDIIWSIDQQAHDGSLVERTEDGNFAPILHTSPPPLNNGRVYQNIDIFSNPESKSVSLAAVKLRDAVFSRFNPFYAGVGDTIIGALGHQKDHDADHPTFPSDRMLNPHSTAAQPVYNSLKSSSNEIVGYVFATISWDHFLIDVVPQGVNGINVILRNSCNQSVTYQLYGDEVNTT